MRDLVGDIVGAMALLGFAVLLAAVVMGMVGP